MAAAIPVAAIVGVGVAYDWLLIHLTGEPSALTPPYSKLSQAIEAIEAAAKPHTTTITATSTIIPEAITVTHHSVETINHTYHSTFFHTATATVTEQLHASSYLSNLFIDQPFGDSGYRPWVLPCALLALFIFGLIVFGAGHCYASRKGISSKSRVENKWWPYKASKNGRLPSSAAPPCTLFEGEIHHFCQHDNSDTLASLHKIEQGIAAAREMAEEFKRTLVEKVLTNIWDGPARYTGLPPSRSTSPTSPVEAIAPTSTVPTKEATPTAVTETPDKPLLALSDHPVLVVGHWEDRIHKIIWTAANLRDRVVPSSDYIMAETQHLRPLVESLRKDYTQYIIGTIISDTCQQPAQLFDRNSPICQLQTRVVELEQCYGCYLETYGKQTESITFSCDFSDDGTSEDGSDAGGEEYLHQRPPEPRPARNTEPEITAPSEEHRATTSISSQHFESHPSGAAPSRRTNISILQTSVGSQTSEEDESPVDRIYREVGIYPTRRQLYNLKTVFKTVEEMIHFINIDKEAFRAGELYARSNRQTLFAVEIPANFRSEVQEQTFRGPPVEHENTHQAYQPLVPDESSPLKSDNTKALVKPTPTDHVVATINPQTVVDKEESRVPVAIESLPPVPRRRSAMQKTRPTSPSAAKSAKNVIFESTESAPAPVAPSTINLEPIAPSSTTTDASLPNAIPKFAVNEAEPALLLAPQTNSRPASSVITQPPEPPQPTSTPEPAAIVNPIRPQIATNPSKFELSLVKPNERYFVKPDRVDFTCHPSGPEAYDEFRRRFPMGAATAFTETHGALCGLYAVIPWLRHQWPELHSLDILADFEYIIRADPEISQITSLLHGLDPNEIAKILHIWVEGHKLSPGLRLGVIVETSQRFPNGDFMAVAMFAGEENVSCTAEPNFTGTTIWIHNDNAEATIDASGVTLMNHFSTLIALPELEPRPQLAPLEIPVITSAEFSMQDPLPVPDQEIDMADLSSSVANDTEATHPTPDQVEPQSEPARIDPTPVIPIFRSTPPVPVSDLYMADLSPSVADSIQANNPFPDHIQHNKLKAMETTPTGVEAISRHDSSDSFGSTPTDPLPPGYGVCGYLITSPTSPSQAIAITIENGEPRSISDVIKDVGMEDDSTAARVEASSPLQHSSATETPAIMNASMNKENAGIQAPFSFGSNLTGNSFNFSMPSQKPASAFGDSHHTGQLFDFSKPFPKPPPARWNKAVPSDNITSRPDLDQPVAVNSNSNGASEADQQPEKEATANVEPRQIKKSPSRLDAGMLYQTGNLPLTTPSPAPVLLPLSNEIVNEEDDNPSNEDKERFFAGEAKTVRAQEARVASEEEEKRGKGRPKSWRQATKEISQSIINPDFRVEHDEWYVDLRPRLLPLRQSAYLLKKQKEDLTEQFYALDDAVVKRKLETEKEYQKKKKALLKKLKVLEGIAKRNEKRNEKQQPGQEEGDADDHTMLSDQSDAEAGNVEGRGHRGKKARNGMGSASVVFSDQARPATGATEIASPSASGSTPRPRRVNTNPNFIGEFDEWEIEQQIQLALLGNGGRASKAARKKLRMKIKDLRDRVFGKEFPDRFLWKLARQSFEGELKMAEEEVEKAEEVDAKVARAKLDVKMKRKAAKAIRNGQRVEFNIDHRRRRALGEVVSEDEKISDSSDSDLTSLASSHSDGDEDEDDEEDSDVGD